MTAASVQTTKVIMACQHKLEDIQLDRQDMRQRAIEAAQRGPLGTWFFGPKNMERRVLEVDHPLDGDGGWGIPLHTIAFGAQEERVKLILALARGTTDDRMLLSPEDANTIGVFNETKL